MIRPKLCFEAPKLCFEAMLRFGRINITKSCRRCSFKRTFEQWRTLSGIAVSLPVILASFYKCCDLPANPLPTAAAWVGFSMLFVCLFSDYISKTDAARITKFDTQMFHDDSMSTGNPFILESKGQRRSRSQRLSRSSDNAISVSYTHLTLPTIYSV